MRRFVLPTLIHLSLIGGVAMTATGFSFVQAEAQQIGLGEKRAIASYRDITFPEQLKAIQAAAGFEVPVEVQWESISLVGQADNYKEPWYATKVFFEPLAKALAQVAVDDMGKSALKNNLKKIVIRYDEASAPASAHAAGLNFVEGVLTINFKPGSNADAVNERAEAIQQLLESKM